MTIDGGALFPLFLKLGGRPVLIVGGGPVATAKARVLAEAGAAVTIVAPAITPELDALARVQGWTVRAREVEPGDVAGVWLVVAAAPPEVNRVVAAAAEAARIFVLAVDDPASATAYGAGIVRRAGVTVAISTSGAAPALAGLLREGIEAVLPDDLPAWIEEARRVRSAWRAEGVPMEQRRPRLLAALNQLYQDRAGEPASDEAIGGIVAAGVGDRARAGQGPTVGDGRASDAVGSALVLARGRVALVGAGPGDPELLTVRGARVLGEADLVLYDALSSEGMRAYAPSARWFYVGKRACRQSIAQDVLNRILIKEAGRGRRVVRLKCGDPFVFGRGGEEALALAAAGIPCEIVPGVSSAIGAAGLAGIPVTHRGVASAFTVVSGHHETVYRPIIEGLPKEGLTLVVLMGLGQREAIAAALIARGWRPETPAAVILGAATPAAWRWTGTLSALGGVVLPTLEGDERRQPGLLVIGEVVAIAAQIEAALAGAAGPTSQLSP